MVQELIREVGRDEKDDRAVSAIYQWHAAVKIFRMVERHAISDQPTPSEANLRLHSTSLHLLIGVGQLLREPFARVPDEKRALLNFTLADLEAFISELKHTLSEWHHEVPVQRLDELSGQIFVNE